MELVNASSVQEENNERRDQEIWSWGAGTDGQLATGKLQDEQSPQLLRSLSAASGPISSLSCGGAHVIALTLGGRVLTWGRGTSGQLGHGEMVNGLQPKAVKALDGFVITHASAGWNHSAFVSDSGDIFTCGDGSFGRLGHGDYESQCSPLKISYFSSKRVEQVACGMRHSLALVKGDTEDLVYGFGSGKRGQLGISKEKLKSTGIPQIALGLNNVKIIKINANGDHSAALSSDGSLYTWGRGFGSAPDKCIPFHYDTMFSVDQVALGWDHALLLTREGDLFMLGGDRHGALVDSQKTSNTATGFGQGQLKDGIARSIPVLSETKVLHIAAGAEHSVLVTDTGSIMSWGWGEHGQLGLGNTSDQTEPQMVSLGHKLSGKPDISEVYCGSGFSFVLRKYDADSSKTKGN